MEGRGSGPTVLECAVAQGGSAGHGQPCAPGLRNAGFCEVRGMVNLVPQSEAQCSLWGLGSYTGGWGGHFKKRVLCQGG